MSNTYHHGDKSKKKKFGKNWQWLQSTPSWWTKLFMNRPQRRKTKLWETEAVKVSQNNLDLLDKPNVTKKPHKYYW